MGEQHEHRIITASILMTVGYALQAISDNKLDKSIPKEANNKIMEGVVCLTQATQLLRPNEDSSNGR